MTCDCDIDIVANNVLPAFSSLMSPFFAQKYMKVLLTQIYIYNLERKKKTTTGALQFVGYRSMVWTFAPNGTENEKKKFLRETDGNRQQVERGENYDT